jgi:hypothetical protein
MNEPEIKEPAAPAPGEAAESRLLAGLKVSLAEKDSAIANLKTTLEGGEKELKRLENSLKEAITGYRELVLAANPGLPEELIKGDSIRQIQLSLEYAKSIAGRIRQEMENEYARHQVPAGAPLRSDETAPLSARDKIQYAMGGK